MRENDNRGAGSKTLYVGLEPFELLVTEFSQTAGLEIQDISQPNEMDAVLVEAVPTRAFAFDAFQITFTVELPTIV